jgi:hypothetical protein
LTGGVALPYEIQEPGVLFTGESCPVLLLRLDLLVGGEEPSAAANILCLLGEAVSNRLSYPDPRYGLDRKTIRSFARSECKKRRYCTLATFFIPFFKSRSDWK